MDEIWRDVVGYEGVYQVSNFGNVRSLDRYVKCSNKPNTKRLSNGKILTKQKNKNGYLSVYFSIKNKGQHKKIHRLVCEAFHEKEVGKTIVNHIDGNKENNIASNLEWCTSKENIAHAIENGLFPLGEDARDSILTSSEVLEIRSNNIISYNELSEKYGVSISTITDIKNFRSWKWLGGEQLPDYSSIDNDKLVQQIKEAKKNSGLSANEFAKTMGVSRSAIHRWETGRRFPSHKFLLKLSEIYGIEIT